jgi:uncharacterized ferredoxin-like protein
MLVRFESTTGKLIAVNPDHVTVVVDPELKSGDEIHIYMSDGDEQPLRIRGSMDEVLNRLGLEPMRRLVEQSSTKQRAVFDCSKCGKRVTVNSVVCDTCTEQEEHEQRERRPRIGQNRIIKVTEQTLREINKAVETAHTEGLASVMVESSLMVDVFDVALDPGNMQESCGYHIGARGLAPPEPGKEES